MTKIAAIRIRGTVNAKPDIIDTLKMLKLHRKNMMIIVEKTESMLGMIKKVKDYVTYGEIDDAFEKTILEKQSEGAEKGFFRLNPPKGGFERKGIKTPFTLGGTLGYRGEKIVALIKKML